MRRIAYVSGSRADYGLMRETLRRIDADDRLQLTVFATGMHLMEEFGNSIELIRQDGFSTQEIPLSFESDRPEATATFLGQLIVTLTQKFREERPDIIMLLGDRAEMLAAACVATYLNIPIAHIHGGDLSKTADEHARHAITKLAHLHFPATSLSAQRIRRMGEEEWRITVTGSPGVATIHDNETIPKAELYRTYDLSEEKPFLLMLQHPVDAESAGEEIDRTLDAIENIGMQTVVIYPNADAGGRAMIKRIEARNSQLVKTEKNVDYTTFLSLLANAAALVGNSSAGIIEAPSFKLPVVNIGRRQEGRERAINVIDCESKTTKIEKAIRKAISDSFKEEMKQCVNPYYHEDTFSRITEKLATTSLGRQLIEKVFDDG